MQASKELACISSALLQGMASADAVCDAGKPRTVKK